MGVGKACQQLGVVRGKMNIYMQSLRDTVGYVSMKIKHAERQAQMFPSMIGLPGEKSSEQELKNLWNMEEGEHGEQAMYAPILNPIEEKDKLIEEQNKQIKLLTDKQAEKLPLEDNLDKMKAENDILKKKLSFTRRVTEKKILDSISNEAGYREDPHLVCVLSATLDEDEFDLVDDTENVIDGPVDDLKVTHRSRLGQFLSDIEDKVDINNQDHQERLSHVKNQVLDRIKSTKIRKLRGRSDSLSTSRPKRRLSFSEDDSARSSSRPRTAPLAAQ